MPEETRGNKTRVNYFGLVHSSKIFDMILKPERVQVFAEESKKKCQF